MSSPEPAMPAASTAARESENTASLRSDFLSANGAPADRAQRKRLLLVLGLCLTFGVVLVGHGLPFWLAAAIFVSTAILSLQYQARKSTGEPLTLRQFATTATIG